MLLDTIYFENKCFPLNLELNIFGDYCELPSGAEYPIIEKVTALIGGQSVKITDRAVIDYIKELKVMFETVEQAQAFDLETNELYAECVA